jgi:hypothetical protein
MMGGDGWERVRVTAHDVARISREFLAEERRSLGGWRFGQEYECLFVGAVDQPFPFDLVNGAVREDVHPLGARDRCGALFVGLDLGQARNPSAIAVVELVDGSCQSACVRHLERVPLGNSGGCRPLCYGAASSALRAIPVNGDQVRG